MIYLLDPTFQNLTTQLKSGATNIGFLLVAIFAILYIAKRSIIGLVIFVIMAAVGLAIINSPGTLQNTGQSMMSLFLGS